ncbi:hypothetical protein D0N50_07290 [Erwinia billingiae]|nr:hypothetical protein D0N50_07290 [Erwinia billingiae]
MLSNLITIVERSLPLLHAHPHLDFGLQQGGKQLHPQELTEVSDWGGAEQPTQLQPERHWGSLKRYSR